VGQAVVVELELSSVQQSVKLYFMVRWNLYTLVIPTCVGLWE